MNRPKHTKRDANQTAIVAELQEAGCTCIVTADLPGSPEANPLDVLVISPDFKRCVLVEIKAGPEARFTVGETAFFRRAGIWESLFEPTEKVVMAAWNAGQILAALEMG